jgi:hypothetical protein
VAFLADFALVIKVLHSILDEIAERKNYFLRLRK